MAAKQTYTVGLLVEHPQRPEWGPGRVVAVGGDRVNVFFRDALENRARVILTGLVSLKVCDSQVDEVLDNLPPAKFDGHDWVLTKTKRSPVAKRKASLASATH